MEIVKQNVRLPKREAPSGQSIRCLLDDPILFAPIRSGLEKLRTATLKPTLQRRVAFLRSPARDETVDSDVLVEVRPFDRLPVREQFPARTFSLRRMLKARIPGERHREDAAVVKMDDEEVTLDVHLENRW